MRVFANQLSVRFVAFCLFLAAIPGSGAQEKAPEVWHPKQQSVFGGSILRTNEGDPVLRFRDSRYWGDVYLIMYRGEPALAVRADVPHSMFNDSWGNVVISSKWIAYQVNGATKENLIADNIEFARGSGSGELKLPFAGAKFETPTRKFYISIKGYENKQERNFLRALMNNFDQTSKQVEDAEGITDADAQLSASAHWPVYTSEIAAANIARARAQDAAEKAEKRANGGVSGWDAATAILTGASQAVANQSTNPIQATTNEQVAAIRAIADAKAEQASQAQQAALARNASQQAASAAAHSQAANATGTASLSVSQTSPSKPAQEPGSFVSPETSPTAGPDESAGSQKEQFLSPLPKTCVRMFWDPQYYNWLSMQNTCSQPIYLSFIFNNQSGWAMNGAMNLAPGAQGNTGFANADIKSAGGFDYYICPANSVPVDLNGQTLHANVTEYQCKPQ